jgi:hypothetical protein
MQATGQIPFTIFEFFSSPESRQFASREDLARHGPALMDSFLEARVAARKLLVEAAELGGSRQLSSPEACSLVLET